MEPAGLVGPELDSDVVRSIWVVLLQLGQGHRLHLVAAASL